MGSFSAIWGGATLGLVAGLILGFFVGSSYWKTVFIAVLIGAGAGAIANLLAGVSDLRRSSGSGSTATMASATEEEMDDLTLADVQLVAQHRGISTYDHAEDILRDPECPPEDAHKLAEELAVAWREDAAKPGFIQPPPRLVELVEQIIGEPVWADGDG